MKMTSIQLCALMAAFGLFQAGHAALLPNPDFTVGDDGKESWSTFLNVFDPSGANYKYGTAWNTETAEVISGSLTLEAHPGWTDNGNGPADLGDVIENNFYVDFGGSPVFAGQEVTFSGKLSLAEALPEGARAFAFIKVLDGGWGLGEFLTADAGEGDGTFTLTTTVPTGNMNAFQVGFATLAPAGADGSILLYDLELIGDSGENLLANPDFSLGEDGKEGWLTWVNVFDPTGAAYKYGTAYDTDTALVNPNFVDLMLHPGWNDNGNGPADLGDVIENNFYVDFGGSPAFAGEEVTFSGRFSVGTPFDSGSNGIAFIKILDGGWGLAAFVTAEVEMAEDGTFSLTSTVPTENMNAFQVGFAVTGTAGANGSMRVWDLSLEIAEEPADLPWTGSNVGDGVISPWFGQFEVSENDWLHHSELGWIYVGLVGSDDNMWMWSLFLESWIWSGKSIFPVVYEYSGERWVYYFILPDIGAYLYDYSDGTWKLI